MLFGIHVIHKNAVLLILVNDITCDERVPGDVVQVDAILAIADDDVALARIQAADLGHALREDAAAAVGDGDLAAGVAANDVALDAVAFAVIDVDAVLPAGGNLVALARSAAADQVEVAADQDAATIVRPVRQPGADHAELVAGERVVVAENADAVAVEVEQVLVDQVQVAVNFDPRAGNVVPAIVIASLAEIDEAEPPDGVAARFDPQAG